MDGHGVMQVEKVGDATGYGKVYEGSQIESDVETPLQIQLKGLAGVISKAGYTIAGVTFIALTVKFLLSDSFPGMPAMDIIAHILQLLYGSGYVDRGIRSGRITDECHAKFGPKHEPYVEDE